VVLHLAVSVLYSAHFWHWTTLASRGYWEAPRPCCDWIQVHRQNLCQQPYALLHPPFANKFYSLEVTLSLWIPLN